MEKEIDIIECSVAKSKVSFMLNTVLWDSFDTTIKSILHSNSNWQEVKFLDENGALSSRINTVPNDAGGIYLFMAKPDIVHNSHGYLMYVGRSRKSASRNLRKRLREYYTEKRNISKRPKIYRMLNGWGEYLYIRYLPLYNCDNSTIEKIEAELISKIIPPFNDEIPNKTIRNAVEAFSV